MDSKLVLVLGRRTQFLAIGLLGCPHGAMVASASMSNIGCRVSSWSVSGHHSLPCLQYPTVDIGWPNSLWKGLYQGVSPD